MKKPTKQPESRYVRFRKWFDPKWKQQKPEWRNKSIWPEGKVAKPGRMG